MEYIHPKKRYSQSSVRQQDQNSNLASVANSFGFNTENLSIEMLSGGFMNANYLISDSKQKAVLRVSATNSKTTKKEATLMNLVKSKGIKAPKCIDVKNNDEKTYALHEYIEGLTLEDYLLENQTLSKDTFNELGEQLAKIHLIEFEDNGLLDEELKIFDSFADIDSFALKYMTSVLSKVSENKLSSTLKGRLLKLLDDKWGYVEGNSIKRRLTHSDFNPKNILVSHTGELEAILDWEFGMSANCIADIGNFFRFSYDYPNYGKEAFIEGYNKVSHLPEEWEKAGHLLDLIAMCSFLERYEDYPETFRTARTIITNTLNYFNY